MKQRMDEILKENCEGNITKSFEKIAEEFNVSVVKVYNRFKTYYNMTPSEYLRKVNTPSKEETDSLILNTTTVKEFWSKLPREHHYYYGIFDNYYKVSTYKKAKEVLLLNKKSTPYKVTIQDNRSIIYSQLLGDGYYDTRRHSLRITHSEKQIEYLKAKVSMINKAYPNTPTEVKIHMHTQGHMYGDWYSKKLGNIDIPTKEEYPTLIPKLTPLGWLLWWLDDGGWYQNIAIFSLRKDLVLQAIETLKTFGIKARECQSGFCMAGRENDIKFYLNFIKPLEHYIPVCMQYKVKI